MSGKNYGAKNGQSKFTQEIVEEMRRSHRVGWSIAEIARTHGVSWNAASNAIKGKTYNYGQACCLCEMLVRNPVSEMRPSGPRGENEVWWYCPKCYRDFQQLRQKRINTVSLIETMASRCMRK